MKKADVYNFGIHAGVLTELEKRKAYTFQYTEDYAGSAISLTIPLKKEKYTFDSFPPFFEGLLPEGIQLESLLRRSKIDRDDYFSILILTGKDLVGSVTVEESH